MLFLFGRLKISKSISAPFPASPIEPVPIPPSGKEISLSLIEFNQTLQQISWDAFDRLQEYVGNVVTEAKFIIGVLEAYDLHSDKGVITDKGLAVQGLHAVNYNVYTLKRLHSRGYR